MCVILFRSRGAEITARVVAACSVLGSQIQPLISQKSFSLREPPKRDNCYRKDPKGGLWRPRGRVRYARGITRS